MKYDIHCKHCDRYLATTSQSTKLTLKCSNSKCKALETYTITFMSDIILNGHKHTGAGNDNDEN